MITPENHTKMRSLIKYHMYISCRTETVINLLRTFVSFFPLRLAHRCVAKTMKKQTNKQKQAPSLPVIYCDSFVIEGNVCGVCFFLNCFCSITML